MSPALLAKMEYFLLALLASQAVITSLFPSTPTVVEWLSRIFGVIAVLAGIIKTFLPSTPRPVQPATPPV